MAKFQSVLVLLFVILAVCSAAAPQKRVRSQRLVARQRQFARQEAATDEVVTPYPSADELKPEVPFEEAAAAADLPAPADDDTVVVDQTAASEPIPDEVYGPPEVYNAPDEVYGPPELDANQLPTTNEEAFARQKQAKQARLVKARRQAAYRQAKSAKLRSAAPAKKQRSSN